MRLFPWAQDVLFLQNLSPFLKQWNPIFHLVCNHTHETTSLRFRVQWMPNVLSQILMHIVELVRCQGTSILISSLVDVYVIEHGHKRGLYHWVVPVQCGISPNRNGFCEEFPMLWIVGNFCTRIQLVLHPFPIAHWKNCSPLEKLPLGLCMVQLLLLKYESFPSTILNLSRHILLLSSILLLGHWVP